MSLIKTGVMIKLSRTSTQNTHKFILKYARTLWSPDNPANSHSSTKQGYMCKRKSPDTLSPALFCEYVLTPVKD